jgi:hypothetical protein
MGISKMKIIDKILRRSEFIDNPPVLIDIGAAGEIDPKWRTIANYSICIAFDADSREMGYVVKECSGYRKLYVYNSIVSAERVGESNFHLTRFPQCSSLLQPRQNCLDNWAFGDLFLVERETSLKTVTLSFVLSELGITKIDWFKTDSQGTDLRLFKSLGDEKIKRVLAAEFEPGIIDAYEGEDKLWSLMGFMEKQPFWMTNINIKGSQRISRITTVKSLSRLEQRCLPALLKTSPGWGEVSFLNSFTNADDSLDLRDYLLGWVFAVVEGQYGFAWELAKLGEARFHDPQFTELEQEALKFLKKGIIKVPGYVLGLLIARIRRLIPGI